MDGRLRVGVLLAALAATAALSAHVPRCRARRPVIAPRPAVVRTSDVRADFPVRAAERLETQLDVVDLLVAFDTSARRWLAVNGKGTPVAYARDRVAKMNEVLENSGLRSSFRFRLAAAVAIDADLSSRSVDIDNLLDYFIDGHGQVVAMGALRKVSDRRESAGADIVSVLTARGGYGVVGVGYSLEEERGGFPFLADPAQIARFGNWAYNICSIEAVDADFTQLHEIGHNMGAGHPDASCTDPSMMGLGPQLYPYSSGYYLWNNGIGYYTVMAYNFGGLQPNGLSNPAYRFEPLPCFSSPDVYWGGKPVGTARNDNRRTLAETCSYVAQYRASVLPVGSTGVTDEENAAAEAAWSLDGNEADTLTLGAFNPFRAMNGQFPYVGGVYSNDVPVGLISLKIGKANTSGHVSRVGGTITMLDGRKYAIQTAKVATGAGPQRMEGVSVKSFGTLSALLGGNGFEGVITDTPYGTLQVRSRQLDGALAGRPPFFRLEVPESLVSAELGSGVLGSCLPGKEPVEIAGNGKWSFRRAASVAYKAVVDEQSGGKAWALVGTDDPARPNLSGLKLTCAARTSTFKGGFTVYLEAGTATAPKLKKVKAKVTGIVIGGEGRGVAVVKGAGPWPVSIW